MVEIPKGLDPQERSGLTGEVSKRGLYVFEPKDAEDNKTGDPKFLEANDPAQADALIHLGYRKASEKEVHAYLKNVEAARAEARAELKKADELPDVLGETRSAAITDDLDASFDAKEPVTGLVDDTTDTSGKSVNKDAENAPEPRPKTPEAKKETK
jgi:hypothetical protein